MKQNMTWKTWGRRALVAGLAMQSVAAYAGPFGRNWAGFRCAKDPGNGPTEVNFPADFGPHYDYSLEWWYYTGNLKTEDNKDVGFHFTIFRKGILPFAATQVYMGHLAVTAPHIGQGFYYNQRMNIGTSHVIARADPYQIALTDKTLWNMQLIDGVPGYAGASYLLQGETLDRTSETPVGLFLRLVDKKGAVLHGNKGYSRKGDDPCNASYYISQTRMELDSDTPGYLMVGDEKLRVVGGSVWMDHEYSTSFVTHREGGWDWISVKFDDQSELMLFHLRKTKDPNNYDAKVSGGSYIDQEGKVTTFSEDDFKITAENSWLSATTQVSYPTTWRVEVPRLGIHVNVKPLFPNQELNFPMNQYWEGATVAEGTKGGQAIRGSGYTELVGYGQMVWVP